MNEQTMKSDRMIRCPEQDGMPARRFADDDRDRRVSSGVGIAILPINDDAAAPRRRMTRSRGRTPTGSRRVLASRPAPANPMAVEPNAAIERNAFAADELLVARDLRDEAVVGRVEELLDAGVDQQER